jgi:hypothetical protein
MGRNHHHGPVRKGQIKKSDFPKIYYDKNLDFASVKIAPGIESRSYTKDGFVFCENDKGVIIEIQILNPSKLAR